MDNDYLNTSQQQDFWMRLDNAAKIYPAVQSEELTAVFRLSCVLKERVRIKPFLRAVQLLEDRFPYFKVKLKRGFFWYYLQYHRSSIPVIPDTSAPCRGFDNDELIFRILIKNNRISVEFSHILTDGSGGFEFMKSLLLAYFESCNFSMPESLP